MSSSKPKSQTADTGGLYGSSTTGKSGTSYNPSDFEKQLVTQTSSAIPAYLQQLISPTYDSEVFKAQTAQRNKLANQSFENNLINPLASRGLTRGSSVNQLSGQFANSLLDAETEAMANEDSRVQNILNSLLSTYQIPYNFMTGLNQQSQGLYGNQQNNSSNLWGNIANAAGTIAGAYFGGPAGAEAANMATNELTK